METPLPRALRVNAVTVLTPQQLRQFQGGDRELMCAAIDEMGQRSKRAQGLSRPITTWAQLLCSEHRLYLSVGSPNVRGGPPTLRGLLRVGERQLYVRRDVGNQTHQQVGAGYTQIAPTCVLDFYVHESCQRRGDGRQLFDMMLAHEGLQAHQLALDRPSPKLLGFYRKHFGLASYTPQDNKFVIYDEYFARSAADPLRRRGGGGGSESAPGAGGGSAAYGRRSGAGGLARRLRDQVAAASSSAGDEPQPMQPPPPQQQQPQAAMWEPLPNKHAFTLQRSQNGSSPGSQPWQQQQQQQQQQHYAEEAPQQPLSPELQHGQNRPPPQQQFPLWQQQQQPPPQQQRHGGPWEVMAPPPSSGGFTSKLAASHHAASASRGQPLAQRAATSANIETLMGQQPLNLPHHQHQHQQPFTAGGGFGGGFGGGGRADVMGGSDYHDQVGAQREHYRRSLEQRMQRRPF